MKPAISMPCAIRSLNIDLLAYSASTCTGLKSPVVPAKLTMSASVTVLENDAVSPTLISAKASSFIAPPLLYGTKHSPQEASGDDHALHFGRALVQFGDLRVAVGPLHGVCLLYTSDAADEEDSVDLGGRRIIK